MTNKYTIRQSVRDALQSIPNNSDFKGYDFLRMCRANLRKNANYSRPYDSTLLRDLRHYRHEFKITVVNAHKSIYHKGE